MFTCVYAGELLKEHGDRGDDDAAEHSARPEEGGDSYELKFECVHWGDFFEMRPAHGDGAFFEERLGFDLEVFELDEFVGFGEGAEGGEGSTGFGFSTVVDEPAGGEGHEDHSDSKSDARN